MILAATFDAYLKACETMTPFEHEVALQTLGTLAALAYGATISDEEITQASRPNV